LINAYPEGSDASLERAARVFPEPMLEGVSTIIAGIETAFFDQAEPVRQLCAMIALATWVLELDKVGRLYMAPRDVAYVYQAGRIAAQSLPTDLRSRLRASFDHLTSTALSIP
jgi:hypothetical protein